jgi:tetratricopeptide (TPR) repeat protein
MQLTQTEQADVSAQVAELVGIAEGLLQAGRAGEAKEVLETLNAVSPGSFPILKLLGVACALQGDFLGAQPHLDAAAALSGDDALVWNTLSVCCFEAGEFERALAAADRTVQLQPALPEAHDNQGNALYALKRYADAAESYGRAGRLNPKLARHHLNLHHSYMLRGEHALAWKSWEWRLGERGGPEPARDIPAPRWSGVEPLGGKTILLLAEQGLGDCIQFVRYASTLEALGAKVILEAYAPQVGLFEGVAGVCAIIAKGAPLPAIDVFASILSLPLAFIHGGIAAEGTPVPYLKAPAAGVAKWRDRLGAERLNVGLVASGSTTHPRDAHRSIPLSTLAEGLPQGANYVLIQKEPRDRDRAFLDQRPDIALISEELGDYADTAALCEALDLVISVDTSIAHLAGALGRPTWILLPHFPDWRWDMEAQTTDLYPTAQTIRQAAEADWSSVTDQIGRQLRSLLDARR